MIKMALMLCSLWGALAFAERPKGYLWYNLPQESAKPHRQKGTSFKKLSYTDKDAVLRFYTMEALHKVRFTHKLEDERSFLILQDYWLKEAALHGRLNQKALLAYPELDFSVSHPASSLGTKLYDDLKLQKETQILQKIAKQQGLIFFYRSQNPIDVSQIPILDAFAKTYGFSWIGVSVDGKKASSLPDSKIDHGEAEELKLHYFPAIMMVNPKEKTYSPVAYGLVTQDVLSRNVMAVYSKFQGGLDA